MTKTCWPPWRKRAAFPVQYLASIDEKAAPSFETIYTLDKRAAAQLAPVPNAR